MSAVLSLDNVTAAYGGRVALNAVTAAFQKGQVTGLVGPNGAGKTTLLRVALNLLPVKSGEVRVLDRVLADWPREELARKLAYLPQGAQAHWPVKVRRIVALGRLPHRTSLAPLSDADLAAVDDALARCDATRFAERRLDELSAGERARVLMARALATKASVLLADEPAAHLDPAHQLRLMELLRDEAARGVAVIVTLHDLALASRYCDNVVVLRNGAVAASGAPDEALSDEALARVFEISALRMGDGRGTIVPWQRL